MFGWFKKLKGLPKMGGLAFVENGQQVLDALGLVENIPVDNDDRIEKQQGRYEKRILSFNDII